MHIACTYLYVETLTYCKDCCMDQSVCMLSITAIAGCTSNTFDFFFCFVGFCRLPSLFYLVFFWVFLALIVGFIVVVALIPLSAPLSVSTAVLPITSSSSVHTRRSGVGTVAGNHLRECVRASCQLVIKDRQLSTLLTAIRVQFVKQNYWFLILHSYLLFCAGWTWRQERKIFFFYSGVFWFVLSRR